MTTTRHHTDTTSRPPRAPRQSFTDWSPRRASLVAGITLALMAVVAGWGNFGAIVPLVTPGNAAQTAQDISTSGLLFRAGIVSLFLVALLDVIAAGALYALFKPVNRRLSAASAWFRVVYSVVFVVAIGHLVQALTLGGRPEEVLRAVEDFTTIWVTGLGLFGVHLVLLGYLAYRSGFVARIFGVLLVIAGFGYLADALGTVFRADFTALFAQVLFPGEVAFIIWLLVRGRRRTAQVPTPTAPAAHGRAPAREGDTARSRPAGISLGRPEPTVRFR